MTTTSATNSNLRELMQQFIQTGRLDAIYLRPARGADCIRAGSATAITNQGLNGDRACNMASRNPLGSKRQVTLIQAEHLDVIAKLIGKPVDATSLRRNLVVSGINLLATKSLFKDQAMQLHIGDVILEITGTCEPCSKMEVTLGNGGYNAMRGHGGVTAKVIKGGEIHLGDSICCQLASS